MPGNFTAVLTDAGLRFLCCIDSSGAAAATSPETRDCTGPSGGEAAMDIKNHRIDEIWYKQSSNIGGTIAPTMIVTHYTTGWSGAGSRDWLLGSAGNTANTGSSAHVVIDRDGKAWQLVPFNRKAWHAGPSRH